MRPNVRPSTNLWRKIPRPGTTTMRRKLPPIQPENERICHRIRPQYNQNDHLIRPKCEQICDQIRAESDQTCDLMLQGRPSATKIRLSIPYYGNFCPVISLFAQTRSLYTRYFARFEVNRNWLVLCYKWFTLYEQKIFVKKYKPSLLLNSMMHIILSDVYPIFIFPLQ